MNDLIVSNGTFSTSERKDILDKLFKKTNFKIISSSHSGSNFTYVFKYDDKTITANILFKNIVNSGWADKPYIKRIQVDIKNVSHMFDTTDKSVSILLGVGIVNNELVFSMWNPALFKYHKTNRSCYINVDSMGECYSMGLTKVFDGKKDIIVFTEGLFEDALIEYYETNKIDII